MQITSGRRADAAATASAPSRCLADHRDVVRRLEDHPEPGAHDGVVVDEQHTDRGAIHTVTRDASGTRIRTRKPPRPRGPTSMRPSRRRRALAHAEDAETRAHRRREPALVGDLELEVVGGVAQPDVGRGIRTPMPTRVGERLLCDAVHVDLHEVGQLHGLADDGEGRRHPALAGVVDQFGEARDPHRRRVRCVAGGRSEGLEQVVQLVECGARLGLDAAEGGARRIRIPLHDRARRTRLHAHRRDVVGDDVVQLSRDAHAVERDGLRGGDLALALEFEGALAQCLALEGRGVRPVAHVVRAAEEGRVDEELHQHPRDEGREDADTRKPAVRVGRRGLEGRDEEPARTCR